MSDGMIRVKFSINGINIDFETSEENAKQISGKDNLGNSSSLDIKDVNESTLKSTIKSLYQKDSSQFKGLDENEMQQIGIQNTSSSKSTSSSKAANYSSDESILDRSTNFEEYSENIGLSSIDENSELDDLIEIMEKIQDEVEDLEDDIKGLDTSDPYNIDDAYAKILNNGSAITRLAQSAGIQVKGDVTGKVVSGVLYGAGAIALTVGVSTVVTAGGVGAAVTGGIAAVAAGASAVPVAGWVVAGVAALALIGIGIFNAVKQDEINKKIDQLKEDLQDASDKVDDLNDDVTEKLNKEVNNNLVPEAEKDLDGLLDDEFKFDNIKDIDSIENNMNSIINVQQRIEPYAELYEKYGLDENEKLSDLADTLGTGDNALKYAQAYINDYASTAQVQVSGNIVKDTEDWNTYYSDLVKLTNSAKKKGLDTTSLESLCKYVQVENQKEEYTVAKNLGGTTTSGTGGSSSGGGGNYSIGSGANNVGTLIGASDTADENAKGVNDNSSSYNTSTEDLEETSEDLQKKAQAIVDEYTEALSEIDGKTVDELEEMQTAGKEALGELSEYESKVDTSKLSELVTTGIPEKQQEVMGQEAETMIQEAEGLQTSAEVAEKIPVIEEKISTYSGYELETTGMEDAKTQVDEIRKVRLTAETKTEMNEYLDAVEIEDKEVAELQTAKTAAQTTEALYQTSEVADRLQEEFGKFDELTTTTIPEAQQGVISEEADKFKAQGTKAAIGTEISAVLGAINGKVTEYNGYELNTSALTNASQDIVKSQENYLNVVAAETISQVQSSTSIEALELMSKNITELISENQSFADIGSLNNVLNIINKKIEELQNPKDKDEKEKDSEGNDDDINAVMTSEGMQITGGGEDENNASSDSTISLTIDGEETEENIPVFSENETTTSEEHDAVVQEETSIPVFSEETNNHSADEIAENAVPVFSENETTTSEEHDAVVQEETSIPVFSEETNNHSADEIAENAVPVFSEDASVPEKTPVQKENSSPTPEDDNKKKIEDNVNPDIEI